MNTAWYSKKWVTVVLHTAVWITLFSMPYLLKPSLNENRPHTRDTEPALVHLRYALNNTIYILLFYFNAAYLLPRYIFRGRYKQYTSFIIALFLFTLSFYIGEKRLAVARHLKLCVYGFRGKKCVG